MGGKGHMMLAKGYAEINGEKLIFVYDPRPDPSFRITQVTYENYAATSSDHHHWNDYYEIGRNR
jgi:hypothetical protein